MRLSWFSTIFLAASLASAAPAPDAVTAKHLSAWDRMPIAFEANAGQWNGAVRFATRTSGYSALFTAAGPSLTLGERSRVDIAMPGSNAAPSIAGLDQMTARTNYMRGSKKNWHFGVANYSRIRYEDVYPGVDVIYYGSNGQLEYDFALRPGADPSAIKLKFHGADDVSVTVQGDLVIKTAAGDLVQKRPVIYQQDKNGRVSPVTGRYAMLQDGAVGVKLDRYDRSLPLVIDPVLVFSSYLGGKAEDRIQGIKVDSQGKLYIVGYTYTADLVATDDAYSTAPVQSAVANMFIAVANTTSAGSFSLQYLTYLGGTVNTKPTGMAIDAEGNVYIAGNTDSADFPMAGASFNTTLPTINGSVFVAKMNPAISGKDSLIYSTFLGGADTNTANGMAVDSSGKIYVIGTTTSGDFPVTDSAIAGVLWGVSDAFLTKIDTGSSDLAYSTYLGGEDQDEGRAIAVGANGLVYFAITTYSAQFPMAFSAGRVTLAGDSDAVVGILDMTKSGGDSLVTSSYFGGSDHDEVRKLALDAQGRVLLTGFTFSSDFPTTPDAVQVSGGGNGDAFVSVIDPSRSGNFLVYSTYLSGGSGDVGYDIAGDASGYIYVTGYTLSYDFPLSADATQIGWGGGADLFVCKLKPGLAGRNGLIFSTYVGETGTHVPTSMAVGSDGTVYIAGYTTLGMPAVGADAKIYNGGTNDGFIVMFSQLAGQPLKFNRNSVTRAPRY